MQTKLTTSALKQNQHLLIAANKGFVETYCLGYTNGKRDKSLDGYYFNSELKIKISVKVKLGTKGL